MIENSKTPFALTVALLATVAPGRADGQEVTREFTLSGIEVSVVGDFGAFSLTAETIGVAEGLEVVRLSLASAVPAPPPEFSLEWAVPSHDIQGHWTTAAHFNKTVNPNWYPSRVTSMLARHAPVLALFGTDDTNRLTFAVSDGLNSTTLYAGVREEDGTVTCGIDFFRERHSAVSRIELEVRFDRRDWTYSRALGDVAEWWASLEGYQPVPVPEHARRPMYSTWYSYHQNVSAPELLREVELARDLGFEAIIVDDGWQTLDSRRGYAFTGDWRPERIPRMREFVDGVHQRGMEILLWYAVSLVGERSEAYARFQGMFLRYWDGQGAYELDPRYPEVREYIIETYRNALVDWGIDGFKFDFIGRFVANESTVLEAAGGRDYASVNEATDRLMTDIMAELRAIDPEVMVEFRQPYIGPLMRKYGNMFRAGDAPNSALANRVRTVDLRLLSGNTAVHSDMIMWHYDEPVEKAALQFLNIMFSVPQVSVRLEGVPAAHLEMISFYTAYWTRNRSVLLEGGFDAANPTANYPLVRAYRDSIQIIARYGDVVIPLDSSRPTGRIDIINAASGTAVAVRADEALGTYRFETRDSRGSVVGRGSVSLAAGVHLIEVPEAGITSLERAD